MKRVRILVTGGGTGGHVSPALAVVQTLREWASRPNAVFAPEFLYVGSETGIEAKLAREAGMPFAAVATGKLRRSSKGLLGLFTVANARDALRVPVGAWQSLGVVRGFKPDVVLATGGYVSVPPVVAAGLLRVPVLVHEQTATFGLANRIAGRFATRIALSFGDSMGALPANLRAKAVVSGNPVRATIFGGDKAAAMKRYGFASADDGLPCVYVTGGAQGSQIINRALEAALPELLKRCRTVHQCGKQPDGAEQDYDRLTRKRSALPQNLQERYHVTPFVETGEIGDLFALTDLLVGRSGAGTVTEVCAVGLAAVFVPLEPTSGNEQIKNAKRLEEVGAARIVPQADCSGATIYKSIRELLDAPAKLAQMRELATMLATPNASNDLATELMRLTDPGFAPPDIRIG
ncbi:MAG: UDP-N-acetylglucosamine--N-acetylmuramyl-(pentapeptide) pyrophosphoryl-undecaprenol N-acetylglucosamine transferase [Armatimonadetes bacterium]|nr:UDP-N-acetylglucosamine--N-acetylmuramyl-(pentapeptide) pyrophosphoryl-undecaprenol N-acetylglucosamine transferase [Armatimonadota bacterium]